MKKKSIIILISIAVAVVVIIAVLTVALKKDYIERIRYDHIAGVSYNGVNIVGEDGLFYLEKNGKKLSEGYVSLKSVNDYYDNIESTSLKNDESFVLFDYYIAHKVDSASYYLVTSSGEEYVIAGDNYSLDEVKLPYITFVNNTTSRKAAISLLKIASDLSEKSGKEIIPKSFSSLQLKRVDGKALYTHIYAIDETSERAQSLFGNDGTLIVSSDNLSEITFKGKKTQQKIYFIDLDTNAVYSLNGEPVAMGIAPMQKISDIFGTMICYDDAVGAKVLKVFSANGVFSFYDTEYDIYAANTFNGALLLPARSEGYALISAFDGNNIKCKNIDVRDDKIICALLENGEYGYFNDRAELLVQTTYEDLKLQTELSENEVYVFKSNAYDLATGNKNSYYFTKSEQKASIMNFEAEVSVSKLMANENTTSVTGTYLLSEKKDGNINYRICTPFAANLLSDVFDSVDTYFQSGIYWSRCASYTRGGYYIIDPISNQKAGNIICQEEDFARLRFSYEGSGLMISNAYDEKSGVPVLIMSVRRYEDNEGTTSSVRYYALYRSASYMAENFNSGMLRMSEVGMNLLRSEPFTFFADDNCLVLNGTGASRVFRLNDSTVLTEAASIPYRVKDIIYDRADQTLLYYAVESEGGDKGLYDKDGNMILAPYYDEIYSLENGRFVVSLRGGVGVLEYRNSKIRQIIDYSYCSIKAISDGGYIAVDGNGNYVLYEGDKIVKKDPIQSVENIVNYSIAEDGTLAMRYNTLLSINGDLYIHNSNTVYKPKCENFEAPDLNYAFIENSRAKLVQYYSDGRIIDTDIIYPLEYYKASFELKPSPNDMGWFFGAEASEQKMPLTKEEILLSKDYIIAVYSRTIEK